MDDESLRDKTILVTGGAGSIGSEIVRQLLAYPVRTIRIFDNNEHALFLLKRELGDPRLRFLLGDIRDRDRCRLMVRKADIIIHCAALKNLELTEFNIPDLIETNVNGALNLARACIYEEPDVVCNVSSDKSVNPTTAYGTSKLQAEFIFKWLNEVIKPTKSYSVRLGNVFESNGNVFEVWREQLARDESLTITDPNMARYYMSCQEAAKFVINTLSVAKGGEMFIPNMKEYKIIDLAKDLLRKTFEQGWQPSEEFVESKLKVTGIRTGEKLREELMTDEEKKRATDKGNYWII